MENGNKVAKKDLNWDNLAPIAKRALKTIAKEQGFVTYKVHIKSGSNLGDGFMSVLARATIIGTKACNGGGFEINENISHEFTVLCKMQLESETRREISNSDAAFMREIALYNEYLPELEKLQLDHGITAEDGFFNHPKCYYADYDTNTDDAIIVMQDMRDEGYKLANKYEPLDIGICEVVVRGLGKLHALSYVLERKCPQIFDKFKGYEDIMAKIMTKPKTQEMWDTVFKTAIESLEGAHPDIQAKLQDLRKNLKTVFEYVVDNKNSGNYSVIGHGDSWTNNFLFKFGSNEQPEDIMFIDWQISRYGSPVLDLLYFLFTATDRETRAQHYDNLLKLYHESLSLMLRKFGEDVNKVYPFHALQQDLKKFGRYGLFMSLLLLSVVTIRPEDLPDMDEASEELMKEEQDGNKNGMMLAAEANARRMKPRIRDNILDIYQYGYF